MSNEKKLQLLSDKHFKLYMLMNEWTHMLQDGRSVVDYLKKKGYKKIAVYGFNYVGETLVRELRNSDIEVAYIVDQNAEYMYAPSRIIKPTEISEVVDVMVVTVLDNTGLFCKELKNKLSFDVMYIGDIIKEA